MTIDDDDRKIIIHFGVSRKKEKKLLLALKENAANQKATEDRVRAAMRESIVDTYETRRELARMESTAHKHAEVFFNQFDARITAIEEALKIKKP